MIKHKQIINENRLLLIILGLSAVGLFIGWKTFWFLTDDAYIAFRYVSNSLLGHGYVWNAPPFLPVEGYTSFLWVVLLEAVWRLLDIEPPDSANVISLIFSFFIIIIVSIIVKKMNLKYELKKWRLIFIALLMIFILLNRTFLAWTSSGLETAMFSFFITAWISIILFINNSVLKAFLAGSISSLLALSRPDGYLFCAATILIIVINSIIEHRKKHTIKILLYGLTPFIIVLLHLIWRFSFYGELLPNTYYAKFDGAWPLYGLYYFTSFLLEYGLWFAVVVIVVALIEMSRTIPNYKFLFKKRANKKVKNNILNQFSTFILVATLILHFSYYTFIIGGDHFEYRIYHHIVPLIFIALIWALNKLSLNKIVIGGILIIQILISLPLQWTHWKLSKNKDFNDETSNIFIPVSNQFPKLLEFYPNLFDRLQAHLILRQNCMRHHTHKLFWKFQTSSMPSRAIGEKISSQGFPIGEIGCAGVPSWVYPHVYFIDKLGLNDYVTAHKPKGKITFRLIAHNCTPMLGYVESYQPNLNIYEGKVFTRNIPMTAEKIDSLEYYWRNKLKLLKK